jgi:hypothetical protein
MATNPFEALLTPASLKARREQEIEKKYSPMGFWANEMAQAGGTVRQALRDQGVGLTPDDRRAALTEGLMQAGSRSFAEMVKEGADPDEAREGVLAETMREFMAAGDYQSAGLITQQLDALSKQKMERRKLKADIAFAESRPELEAAKVEAQALRAEAAGKTAEATALRAENERLRNPSAIDLNTSRARLADRQPVVRPVGGGGGAAAGKDTGVRPNASTVAQLNDQVAAALGLLDKASKYETLLATRPGLTAPASAWAAWTQSQASGFLNFTGGGVSPNVLTDSERAVYLSERGKIQATANRLNVDKAVFDSLALDLAYAIARTNDSGRLSNQDFEVALRILGGSPDATAAVATLRNSVGSRVDNIVLKATGWKGLAGELVHLPELQQRAGTFKGTATPAPVEAPPEDVPPAKPRSAAERLRDLER